MTRATPPPEIVEAARRRSAAREARDWPTADQLRAEIEAAGWRVVDSGRHFRLEAVHPPEVVDGDVVRYGRSEAVPSRFNEPDEGPATIVIVADVDVVGVIRAVAAIQRAALARVSVVIVANGMGSKGEAEVEAALRAPDGPSPDPDAEATRVPEGGPELVRTSARLAHAAALNVGLRRAIGSVVVVLEASVEAEGDFLTPLVRLLEDPTVGVVGPLGYVSGDLRKFDQVVASGPGPAPAVAVQGDLIAFRRSDAAARGPLDEQFRVARNLDIWWSLVLRDEGEGLVPRRALVLPDLPLQRHDRAGGTRLASTERERLAKRSFYRMLERFGRRLDLAVPGE